MAVFVRDLCVRAVIGGGPRQIHRWVAPTLMALKRRRDRVGPVKPSHRSTFLNWNYTAEVFAFGKRLQEDMDAGALRAAFTHASYVQKERRRRDELGLTDGELRLQDNAALVLRGDKLIYDYVGAYLRTAYTYLPEEGICAIRAHLVGDEVLAHVALNIGSSDLILCEEFPPSTETLAKTYKAVVAVVLEGAGELRAQRFVQDFVLTQLIGKDVNELWEIRNPMGMLVDILSREKRALPESRLMWQSGQNTIKAVYNIGVYSDRSLIGIGAGETVAIAEEMAARDALKRMFRTTDKKSALPFGKRGQSLRIDVDAVNPSISGWTTQVAEKHKLLPRKI